MKFIKSNLAKKLIVLLITIILLNVIVPKKVNAALDGSVIKEVISEVVEAIVEPLYADLGGILLKPIYLSFLTVAVCIDTTIGLTLNGISLTIDALSTIIDIFMLDSGAILDDVEDNLRRLFIGPDTIFVGDVTMLDANIFRFINGKTIDYTGGMNTINSIIHTIYNKINSTEKHSPDNALVSFKSHLENMGEQLSPGGILINNIGRAVAETYVMLRNICGLIMLAGLIYTGIKILLSANIPNKKQQAISLLQDWLIGMGLLIFSHIIMILIFYISDMLVNLLATPLNEFGGMNYNLFKSCLQSYNGTKQFITLVMLIYLIWLTIIFIIAYFKRFFWICVLIVFAPIFSVLYSFGQQTKQMYGKWLKEYIVIVFVQPFHLIVYSVLIGIPLRMVQGGGNPFNLGQNVFESIYALIAMSFIRPAEKYVRSLIGMNQGIANVASYDSGKQTYDATKKAISNFSKKIEGIIKTVAMAILSEYTGGAAGAIEKAAGGMSAGGAGGSVTGGSAIGSSMGDIFGKTGDKFNEGNMFRRCTKTKWRK